MRRRALALAALLAAPVAAQEPRVENLAVSLRGHEVHVSFALVDGFDDELLERIQTGLPSGFIYRFKLYRDHKRWFDDAMGQAAVEVVAMYNAVTQEYLVNTKLDDRLISSQVVRDAADLEQAMTRFSDLRLFTLEPDLPRSWKLLLRMRTEFGARTKFLFVPTTVATPWIRSRKFRPPATAEP